MQLPFSQEELDEFVTPEGEVFYTFRSIVYDSWLIWDDALPDVLQQRELPSVVARLQISSGNTIQSHAMVGPDRKR